MKRPKTWTGGDDDLDFSEEAKSTSAPKVDKILEHALSFLNTLLEKEETLKNHILTLPQVSDQTPQAPAPPAAPKTVTQTTYSFDVDVVFQTLYELCTNETVKDHIKAMRADQKAAFDQDAVKKNLQDLAPTVDVEDNFFNFPINAILKGLFAASKNEKHKQVLKKMNQTASSIFLDTFLPIEGEVSEQEVLVESESAPPEPAPQLTGLPPETVDTILDSVEHIITEIQKEKERLQQEAEAEDEEPAPPAMDLPPGFTQVSQEDREQIISAIEAATTLVTTVGSKINGILESLSFQDLSGQRIFKIVRLIGNVQVQLLSLLVSFGAKIKQKDQMHKTGNVEDTERMAQAEVDRMLERISAPSTSEPLGGPSAEGRLNQGAVDELLADLGF